MPELCRTCKQPIRWAVTTDHRRIPIDPEPADDGNLRLMYAQGERYPTALVIPAHQRAQYPELYRTHFAICPDADQHRRPR